MYIFTPDLSERKRLLRNVCRTHPQWKIRITLAVVLFIMAIGVLCGFACLLMAHPTSTEGVAIFTGAAVCFACIPFAFALSVKNTAKYKCAFPYSGYANASLLLDEDTLEYVFWRVGPQEPAAYSSKRAVYRAEDRFVYKINKAEITSLTIKQHLFTKDECRQLTQKTCEKLTEEINDFYAEQRKEFEAGKATIEFLSSEGERLVKELSALRRENKALEKECYQLRKENGTLGEELARVAALGLEETSPLPDTDTEDDLLDSYVVDDADVNEPEELPELPDTGIMFVGGHPNFLKKLREVYPDWSYITKENVPERLRQYSKQKMCYIYTAHTSHPIYWGVINALRNCDTPYSYIKGTNLDRVITEMRQDYAEAYKNNKGDERHD